MLILGDLVSGLEKETMQLRHQVSHEEEDEKLLLTYEWVVSYLEEIKDQYQKIYRAVTTLVALKRLNTSVASPPDVYQKLTLIASQLRAEGMELLMEESQEVYKLDASYILLKSISA